jgi:hypothetical protein
VTCAAIDESVLSLAVLNADGWGLELTFWIEANRCAHRLAAIDGTRRVVLLESIEGTADDLWPPSPPWQQVNAPFAARRSSGKLASEKRASGKLASGKLATGNHAMPSAMLVGAAGASHWSASVEGVGSEWTQTEEGQNLSPMEVAGCEQLPATGLLFDVACRAKSQPERLSSTYCIVDPRQLVSPSQMVTRSSASGQFSLRGGVLELQTVIGRYQLRGLPLAPTQLDSCQLDVSDGHVQLSAPVHWNSPEPTTFRWRYHIGLVAHSL